MAYLYVSGWGAGVVPVLFSSNNSDIELDVDHVCLEYVNLHCELLVAGYYFYFMYIGKMSACTSV